MAANRDKIRLLLVSEQSADREGYKLLQRETKFRILAEAKSVKEAIEITNYRSPDFIVVDNVTARPRSIETIKRLRKSCPETPLIIMSGQTEETFIAEMIQAGASAYIIKQNIGQELTRAVLKIGQGQVYLSPFSANGTPFDVEKRSSQAGYARRNSEELTRRQKEILKLLVQGLTNKQVAQRLKLSVKTVDAHRANIMNKLDIHGLPGLVKYAIRTGLASIED